MVVLAGHVRSGLSDGLFAHIEFVEKLLDAGSVTRQVLWGYHDYLQQKRADVVMEQS
jgi:hypothetical protein